MTPDCTNHCQSSVPSRNISTASDSTVSVASLQRVEDEESDSSAASSLPTTAFSPAKSSAWSVPTRNSTTLLPELLLLLLLLLVVLLLLLLLLLLAYLCLCMCLRLRLRLRLYMGMGLHMSLRIRLCLLGSLLDFLLAVLIVSTISKRGRLAVRIVAVRRLIILPWQLTHRLRRVTSIIHGFGLIAITSTRATVTVRGVKRALIGYRSSRTH